MSKERFTKWTPEERELLENHYTNMINRCSVPSFRDYKHYGGRGISVCREWTDPDTGRRTFVDWAMSHGYKPGLTIDRIDVDGNYTPENCRWVTIKEQCNNTRRNVFVEVKGYRRTLKQWSEFLDYEYWRLKWMYHKFGIDKVRQYISQYVSDDLSKLATGQLPTNPEDNPAGSTDIGGTEPTSEPSGGEEPAGGGGGENDLSGIPGFES